MNILKGILAGILLIAIILSIPAIVILFNVILIVFVGIFFGWSVYDYYKNKTP